ncbi:MAG: T9SS type A sorting domain-containing protein [Bacteroidota bacterium]|jgi:hypothetical protein
MRQLRLHVGIIALTLLSTLSLAQSTRTWTQTSVADFVSGTSENTVVTNNWGGEVQLAPPLLTKQADTVDNTFIRFRAYNKHRQFIRYWVADQDLYVQRYDSLEQTVGPTVKVNDGDKRPYPESPSVGLLNNGCFYVAWQAVGVGFQGQLFDSSSNKVGANQTIDDRAYDNPSVLANETDATFWIFASMLLGSTDSSDSMAIFYWRMNLQASVIDGPLRIHSVNYRISERMPRAISDAKGNTVLVYTGSNSRMYGGDTRLMLQRFAGDGSPLSSILEVSEVRDISFYYQQIAFDGAGRFLVVWADSRDVAGRFVYGQLFDSIGSKIGRNFRVDIPRSGFGENSLLDLFCQDDFYTISWLSTNSVTYEQLVVRNQWQYNKRTEGCLTSSIHDAGPIIQSYNSLSFVCQAPIGTLVKFRLRAGNTYSELDTAQWYGPTDSIDAYYTISGEPINPRHDQKRYMQWKAYFSSRQWGSTAVLEDVSVAYTLSDAASPTAPSSVSAQGEHGMVTLAWQPSPSPAVMGYKIFRGTSPALYDPQWTKEVTNSTFVFNDTAVANGTSYYYAITVFDSNFLESSYSPEVAATPFGITMYVSVTAGAGGDGTSENPFSTIQDAMAHALAFDTVQVLPGIYNGRVIIKPYVSLTGSGPRVTVIQAGNDSGIITCKTRSSLTAFTIKQIGPLTALCAVWAGDASPTIVGNVIIDASSPSRTAAAHKSTHGRYPLDAQADLIFANGGSPVVERNYIVGFAGIGIDGSSTTYASISNNIMVTAAGGIQVYNDAAAFITNNTIIVTGYDASPRYVCGEGISLFSYPPGDIRNNIIIGSSPSGGAGLIAGPATDYQRMIIAYNNVWNFQSTYEAVKTGPGNISADPLFTNSATGDYRLKSGSPCRNAGDSRSSYNNLDGSRNDMGAFGGPHPIDPSIFPGFAVSFTLGSTSGFPGDTVSIGASIDNPAHLSSLHFSLEYDPAMIILSAVNKTQLSGLFQLDVDSSIHGRTSIALSQAGELGAGNGELLKFQFLIVPTASADQASPLTVTGLLVQDSSGQPLVLSGIQHGTVAVSPGSNGGRYVFVDQRNTSGMRDGTRHRPFASIQSGIGHASPGDTVIIAAGLYKEAIVVPDSLSIRGSGANGTILQVDSADAPNAAVTFSNSRGSRISGLTISKSTSLVECNTSSVEIYNCALVGNSSGDSKVLSLRGNSQASIHDNYFVGGTSGFPISTTDSVTATIFRNIIRCSGPGYGIGITGGCASINNNRIYAGGGNGSAITIFNSHHYVQINNNLFRSVISEGGGILASNSDSIEIINNTFDTKWTGIECRNSTAIIMNNIVTGNLIFGVGMSLGSVTSYNDVWGNTTDYHNGSTGTGDISHDPWFVDVEHENYRLLPNSPCKNAGNPDPAYYNPDSSRNDMGLLGGRGLDTTFFQPGGTVLQILGTQIAVNETVVVPVSGSLLRGTATADLQLAYNPSQLDFVGAKTTPQTSMFSLSQSQDIPGNVTLTLRSFHGLSHDSLSIVEVHFVARQTKGNSSVTFRSAKLYNETTAEIPISKLISGTVVVTSVDEKQTAPHSFSLKQNYPNPFNPSTTLQYTIARATHVELKVYNILGQQIKTLISEMELPGSYKIVWDGTNAVRVPLSSGVYIGVLQAGDFRQAIKMLLLR